MIFYKPALIIENLWGRGYMLVSKLFSICSWYLYGLGAYFSVFDCCLFVCFFGGVSCWHFKVFIHIYFLCHIKSRSPSRLVEDFTPDIIDGKSPQTTPRSTLPPSKSASSSRRGSALLPSQQSCEVDDEALTNENSLMTELMQVQQLSVSQDMFVVKLFQWLQTEATLINHLHVCKRMQGFSLVCLFLPCEYISLTFSPTFLICKIGFFNRPAAEWEVLGIVSIYIHISLLKSLSLSGWLSFVVLLI